MTDSNLRTLNPSGTATPTSLAHQIIEHADKIELIVGIVLWKGQDGEPPYMNSIASVGTMSNQLIVAGQMLSHEGLQLMNVACDNGEKL